MPEPSRPNIFEMQSQSAGTLLTPLRDNPVNALPRWIKTHLLVGRITLFIMVVIGGPALIAFGIMTRNDLRDECVLCLHHEHMEYHESD